MRIQLETSGGFAFIPALAQPIAFDTSTLSPAELAELRRLVAAAQFFTRPPDLKPPVADGREYRITIDDAGTARTLEFRDPVDDAAVLELVAFIRSIARP